MKERVRYSKEFKEEAIRKFLITGPRGIEELAKNLNIHPMTLYKWKSKYVSNVSMKKSKNLTREQKLEILIKTSSMNEAQVGEYLRSQGLYTADLERFKKDLVSTEASRPAADPEALKLKKQNHRLERELQRKDKALAEYAARVVLLKKSHEIWGKDEED
jgi:transposase